jgi:predicted AAA+ superfamily ATPase
MFRRLQERPDKSFFLFGPRGTGKSTWLHTQPFALKIDFLRSRERLDFERDPGILEDKTSHLKKGDWVLIDEVQKVPAILDEVHALYESKKVHFALSGSSARKLKRSGANLLAGRALNCRMYPLVYPEYRPAKISHDTLIDWGSLPLILDLPARREETLEAYVDNYLRQELTEEGIVRKIEPFSRFLQIAGQMNGQILNVESIAREAKVKRPTVDSYIEVLTDTLIAFRLPSYKPALRINEVNHPKLYFFDSGVARAASGLTREEIDPSYRGFLFETWLLNEIRCYNDYSRRNRDLFYYAVRSGGDIDLIIQLEKRTKTRPDKVIAIEFKLGRHWRSEWAKFLTIFQSAPSKTIVTRKIIVYTGTQRRREGDIDVLPVDDFLSELHAGSVF